MLKAFKKIKSKQISVVSTGSPVKFSKSIISIITASSGTISIAAGCFIPSVANIDYSQNVKDRTLSLTFGYKTNDANSTITNLSGTGWIWKNVGSYYYIATNLHVGAALTYPGNTFTTYNGTSTKTVSYSSDTSASIGFDVGDDSTQWISLKLNTVPTVVYTTLNDESYNSAINTNYSYYYSGEKLSGISDICILRYDFSSSNISASGNATSSITLFNEWLYNYSLDPTYIYNGEVSLDNKKFFSGGYPSVNTSLGKQLEWKPMKFFTVNKEVTKSYSQGWNMLNGVTNNTASSPISFVDKTYIKSKYPDLASTNDYSSKIDSTNFINTSYTGYFNSYSDHGASGSLLGTYINGHFSVIGIYWGSSTFEINNGKETVSQELGAFDLFVCSKYNLVTSIDNAITSDYNNISSKIN